MQSLTNGIRPDLIKASEEKVAQISLQDCLACSGCVTSAEAVLIEQHSVPEVSKMLASPQNTCVISVSPQSIASLALLYNKTERELFSRLQFALSQVGFR